MSKTVAAEDMKWGFPGYDGKSLLINVRAESVMEKRIFQESVWNKFRRADYAPLLFMAGCYNLYDGKNRFVILTTQANASMAPVHDRMPLILERNEVECWLGNYSSSHAALFIFAFLYISASNNFLLNGRDQ